MHLCINYSVLNIIYNESKPEFVVYWENKAFPVHSLPLSHIWRKWAKSVYLPWVIVGKLRYHMGWLGYMKILHKVAAT